MSGKETWTFRHVTEVILVLPVLLVIGKSEEALAPAEYLRISTVCRIPIDYTKK